jgi:hypothetical protein
MIGTMNSILECIKITFLTKQKFIKEDFSMDKNKLFIKVMLIAKKASRKTYIDKIEAIRIIDQLLNDAVDEGDYATFLNKAEEMAEEELEGNNEFEGGPEIDEMFGEVTDELFGDCIWYYMYMQTDMEHIDSTNDCFSISKPIYTDFGGCMYLAGKVSLLNEDDEELIIENGCDFNVENEKIISALEDLAISFFVIRYL